MKRSIIFCGCIVLLLVLNIRLLYVNDRKAKAQNNYLDQYAECIKLRQYLSGIVKNVRMLELESVDVELSDDEAIDAEFTRV